MPEPTTDVGEPAEGAEDGSEARVGEPANDVGEASSKTSTGTSETDEWSREAWLARGVVARTESTTWDGGRVPLPAKEMQESEPKGETGTRGGTPVTIGCSESIPGRPEPLSGAATKASST